MKRFLASALIIGAASVGLVGCEQKEEVKKTTESSGPNGKEKVTETTKVEKSGDAKDPAPTTPEAPK